MDSLVSLGRVKVETVATEVLAAALPTYDLDRLSARRCIWSPTPKLKGKLPGNFRLAMLEVSGIEGGRRFIPERSADRFILEASLGGFAIHWKRDKLTRHQRFSYNAMRLVFQRRALFSEYFDRTFRRQSDFELRRGAASGTQIPHVLPPDLGLNSDGTGAGMNPAQLIAEFKSAIETKAMTAAQEIRSALAAAARRYPYPIRGLTEAGACELIRKAFFGPGRLDYPLEPDQAEEIEVRFVAALEKHIGLNSKAFREWCFEKNDGIVHAISKRKSNGIELSRSEVLAGMLDMTHRSLKYAGDCVNLQMRAFAAALPDPMSAAERQRFDALYAARPHWGGYPLVLLHDRFEFLGGLSDDLLERPDDPDSIGAALRLLVWYGEIVPAIRRDERESKRRGNTATLPTGSENSLPPTRGKGMSQETAILKAAIVAGGDNCRCSIDSDWSVKLMPGTEPSHDPIRVTYGCEACGVDGEASVSRANLQLAQRDHSA